MALELQPAFDPASPPPLGRPAASLVHGTTPSPSAWACPGAFTERSSEWGQASRGEVMAPCACRSCPAGSDIAGRA